MNKRTVSFYYVCLFSGEIVTAMYDNFVAYRSKIFRPESPIAPDKNAPKLLGATHDPGGEEVRITNPLWQPIPLDSEDAPTAALIAKDKNKNSKSLFFSI